MTIRRLQLTVRGAGLGAVLISALNAGYAHAEVQTQYVDYQHGDATLSGYLAYDDAVVGRRPGILVFHDRAGLTQKSLADTRMMAAMGYVVFSADMFGKGILPQSVPEMREQTDVHRADRAFMRARAQTGLDVLSANPMVDASKIATIGYCFGGTVAIELAETGAQLAGIVPVHGSYDGFESEEARNIQGPVLILHGGEDRPAPLEEVLMFVDDLRAAEIVWQMELYSGAGHGFSEPGSPAEERAASEYRAAIERFFAEIFGA
jgi:dienelactone hydrolase